MAEYVADHYVSTFGVGAYGGLDDRRKRKGRKQPIGFAPPKQKAKPKRKAQK